MRIYFGTKAQVASPDFSVRQTAASFAAVFRSPPRALGARFWAILLLQPADRVSFIKTSTHLQYVHMQRNKWVVVVVVAGDHSKASAQHILCSFDKCRLRSFSCRETDTRRRNYRSDRRSNTLLLTRKKLTPAPPLHLNDELVWRQFAVPDQTKTSAKVSFRKLIRHAW